MSVSCPHCGSRFLKESRPRTVGERLRTIFGGERALRCKDCKKRFIAKTFVWYDILFARCPKCHRMDLNGWSLDHYKPHGWTKFRLALGAKRYRCEYCRLNFASSRRRKERFTFHRWEHRENYYHD